MRKTTILVGFTLLITLGAVNGQDPAPAPETTAAPAPPAPEPTAAPPGPPTTDPCMAGKEADEACIESCKTKDSTNATECAAVKCPGGKDRVNGKCPMTDGEPITNSPNGGSGGGSTSAPAAPADAGASQLVPSLLKVLVPSLLVFLNSSSIFGRRAASLC